MRWAKRVAAVIGSLVALVALVTLVFLFRPAFTPSISGGVALLEQLSLSGDLQAVLTRGHDRSKPILLFLHGGPGMPAMFLAHRFQRPLERDFLVVHWDRRGAGKSYREDIDPSAMRTSRELSDAVSLIEALQQRHGRRPVLLVGHSYGSWLGVALALSRPDLITAYVGVGQTACTREEELRLQDEWLAKQAAAAGDAGTVALARKGGGWDRESALFRYGGVSTVMDSPLDMVVIGLVAPEYNGLDVLKVRNGVRFTHANFVYDGPARPLWETATAFQVPVHLFVGRHDYVTPSNCAERYFRAIEAPDKRFVWFEGSAHFPFLEEPQRFYEELIKIAVSARPS
jgi:pimeloyl-ACP methyl ester carboxylesterase